MAGKVLLSLTLIAIVVVGSAYYITYREKQSASVGKITSLSQIDNVAATECTYPEGTFGTGSGGSMYIYNDQLFVDIQDLETNGYSGTMEASVSSNNTLQMSPTSVGAQAGYQVDENALNTVITQAPWQCSPWWFPNGAIFNIPNAVTL